MAKQVQPNSLIVYSPCPLPCFESSVGKMERIFGKKCFDDDMIPCPQKIRDGVLWIDSHGAQHPGRAGYMIRTTENSVYPERRPCIRKADNGYSYLPSSCLPAMFDVHKSIIVLDNCYSSEVSIDTLSKWKDNMIFTTGYIKDYYDRDSTGMIKALEIVMEKLRRDKGIKELSYRTVKENKDYINGVFADINARCKTQYNLF